MLGKLNSQLRLAGTSTADDTNYCSWRVGEILC